MLNNRVMLLGSAALLALCVSAASGSAWAQSAAPAAASAAPEANEIVVTGTNIRGVAPVGSTILSIGHGDIEAMGAVTALDILRDQPVVSNLGISSNQRLGSNGGANISYANSIDLRGLGSEATLTLLDGHRMASSGTTAQAPDPEVLPTIMIQRADVVADGASATYGSDAVAGVVNFILRRVKRDTAEFTAYAGFGDHYSEQQFDGLLGKAWDSGQITVGVQYSNNSNLSGLYRSYFASDLTSRGGSDFRSAQCSPGTLTVSGTTYAIPAGGVTTATAGSLVPGTVNKCDIWKSLDLVPRETNESVAGTFDQTFGIVHFYGDGYYDRRTYSRQNAPPVTNLTVASTNPFFVRPPGSTATTETVGWWFGNQGAGNSYTANGYSANYTVNLGADVRLPFSWELDVHATGGQDADEADDVRYNPTAAQAAVNAGTLNPFASNSATVINSVRTSTFDALGHSHYQFYDVKLDGPLISLPAGQVKLAVGYSHQYTDEGNGLLAGAPGNLSWSGGFPILFKRHVDAEWGELLIPVFSAANAMPGFQSLDIDVSARTSDYSDVGHTTNPKVGVNWQPVPDLKLHGSWGQSFRAPLLSDIYQPVAGGSATLTLFALPGGGVGNGYIWNRDATYLVPETATTWTLGGDWHPAFAPHFSASLNYFNIDYVGQIAKYTSSNILLQASTYAQIVTLCPSTACTALYNQLFSGPNAIPVSSVSGGLIANPVALTNGSTFNAGVTSTDGLDFDFAYKGVDMGSAGRFGAELGGTYYLSFKTAVTATAPVLNVLNTINYPLQLRMLGRLTWDREQWSGHMDVNYTGGYKNNIATPVQNVASYTTLDLFLFYNFKSQSKWIDGARLGVSVKNALDANPPFVNIAPQRFGGGGYDPQSAGELGRITGVSFSKSF